MALSDYWGMCVTCKVNLLPKLDYSSYLFVSKVRRYHIPYGWEKKRLKHAIGEEE